MDKARIYEYEIRKDFRSNRIVREVDRRRQRELWMSAGVGVVLVAVLLSSAWLHFELLQLGYDVEELQKVRAVESDINRHLRLEMAALRAPHRIEKLATERLGMVSPGATETVVLERVTPTPPPATSVIARR